MSLTCLSSYMCKITNECRKWTFLYRRLLMGKSKLLLYVRFAYANEGEDLPVFVPILRGFLW